MKRPKVTGLRRRESWQALPFLLPSLLGLCLFYLFPQHAGVFPAVNEHRSGPALEDSALDRRWQQLVAGKHSICIGRIQLPVFFYQYAP